MLASKTLTAQSLSKQTSPDGLAPPSTLSHQKSLASVSVATWASFSFAVLQSVCTFFAALGTLRLFFGAALLVTVSQIGIQWDRFHLDAVRIPMMALASAGAFISLVSLLRRRALRNRPASQWRQKPLASRQIFFERVQIAVQIFTFVLLISEEVMHLRTFHHL